MNSDSARVDLAVAICTKDSMRTLERTLRSMEGLHTRLLVVDSGSTDGTLDLCRRFGAEILHREWGGFIAQRQFALDQCREHRWVLMLDSDESLEPNLRQALVATLESDDERFRGYELNRKVWFMGDWLHHAFQPEWRLRLVRGGAARVVGREPHDSIIVDGAVGRLRGELRHDSWADLRDMLRRSLAYAEQAAAAGAEGGSMTKILLSGPLATLKQLMVKRGVLDGWRGVAAAVVAGIAAAQKQLLIAQRRRGDAQAD